MIHNSRLGFTLIELLIFSAIFSIIAVSFFGVLVSAIQIQTRQTAVAEVNQQSQFLLETIQRYVESSSIVELPSDTATTTLKLRMASSTSDPTYIYLNGTAVYYKETDSGVGQPLTSDKVSVSNLLFTKRANPPGHDSVNVVFTVAYNTTNIKRAFLQALQISVARVSAATFDANVIPSTNNTFSLGVSSQAWQSINNTIYFSGSNVGIGTTNPNYVLDVNGGFRVISTSTFSGNVGIGTTGPTGSLTIQQARPLLELQLQNGSNTVRMGDVSPATGGSNDAGFVDIYKGSDGTVGVQLRAESTSYFNGGNVGIGTASPATLLHLYKNDSSSGNSAPYLRLTNPNSTTGNSYSIIEANAGPASARLVAEGIGAANSYIANSASVLVGSASSHTLGFLTANIVRAVIDTSGNVGIGTTAPGKTLDVVGSARIGTQFYLPGVPSNAGNRYLCLIDDGTAQISHSGSCGGSDRRLKKDIRPLEITLDKVNLLKPVRFQWMDPKKGLGDQIGLIAQDVEEVYPELVTTDDNGMKAILYEKLVAPVIAAVQELYAKLKDHNQRIQALEKTIQEQQIQIKQLQTEITSLLKTN